MGKLNGMSQSSIKLFENVKKKKKKEMTWSRFEGSGGGEGGLIMELLTMTTFA